MTAPRISVLIPAFNHELFVGEAVRSALEAVAPGDEVLVLDDGSSDRTPELLAALAERETRVVFERQSNAGAHVALNRLLARARGGFVAILNSDDRFAPSRLDRLTEALEGAPDAVLAASWIRIVDHTGAAVGAKHGWHDAQPWPSAAPGRDLHALSDPSLALLQSNWISTTSNLVFRRSLVTEHRLGFAPLRYAHDWDFVLTACALGEVAVVEEELVDYRVHEANTIREGGEAARGEAAMQFEICWVLACHVHRILARATGGGRDGLDLLDRLVRSRPPWAPAGLLARLLLLRGVDTRVPATYRALLDSDNSVRHSLVSALTPR